MQNHSAIAVLQRVRNAQPLVHNITNYVVMSLTANALLAINASPIMAHASEEVEEIIHHAHALVINIGTLETPWLNSMRMAMKAAKNKSIPIILDPVGAGATLFRTQSVLQLIAHVPPNVIRGNAAEILALSGHLLSSSKGVDSVYASETARQAAQSLAECYGCVVVISGEKDFIISQKNTACVIQGTPMMARVTGLGCTATALIAAFCATEKDYFSASVAAMAIMGLAGELAMDTAKGPGSFQTHFIDALFNL